jgi:predicted RNA-binding protein YlxR (DUF448 family)
MRMCIGCREMKPKKELIRMVRSPDGEIGIDLKGKAPGRGAYLCCDQACVDRAVKSRFLEKAFEMKIEQEVYKQLKAKLNEGEVD